MLLVWAILAVMVHGQVAQTPLPTRRVLFIGNSLTLRNNLPQMVKMMIQKKGNAKGETLSVTTVAQPAASLNLYAADRNMKWLIESPNAWTHVVLQEQSQKLSFGNSFSQYYVWPAATTLAGSVNANKPAQLIWYQTMANAGGNFAGDTFYGMQDRINSGYDDMNTRIRKSYPSLTAKVSPVGRVWERAYAALSAMNRDPFITLYSDSVHPNTAGTYMAALVFYRTIVNKTAASIGKSYVPRGVPKWFVPLAQKWVDDELGPL